MLRARQVIEAEPVCGFGNLGEVVDRAALPIRTRHQELGRQQELISQSAQTLLGRNVDGLIVASSRREDPLPRQLREQGVPHALVLRTDGISPSSVGDDELGGYLATRHLIDLGHTDIAVLPGPLFTSTAAGRLDGSVRALRDAGLTPNPDWIVETGFDIESGMDAGQRLFDSPRRPTAVFAANDNLALGVMAAAHQHALAVGRILPWSDTTTFRSRTCCRYRSHRCARRSIRSPPLQWI